MQIPASSLGEKRPSAVETPRRPVYAAAKRTFDVLCAGAGLVLISPLLIVAAIAVRLDSPGPIFFTQQRVGRNFRPFWIYKLRTMVADADQRGGPITAGADPRITRVGRVLRKTKIDELPQLINVLVGDMSLVGPRPAFRHELERYEFWHKRKLSIKPGITCLWQVQGRNKINNFDDWVKMDLTYIDNWSLWLDFKILVRTVFVVVTGYGAA